MDTEMRRATFKHIEAELYNFQSSIKEIDRLKNTITMYADPEALMIKHRKIEQLERIVESIEWVYTRLPDEKKRLIVLRYWTHPRTMLWGDIAAEINIGPRQASRWRNAIVWAIAERLGWR